MKHITDQLTDVGRVVRCPKDELWRAVVAGTDVADVGLASNKDLRGAKIAELEDARGRVEKEVLRLDIAVANADGVDVHERAEELVHVELDLEHWHGLLELSIVPAGTIHGLGDVFEHEIEVHFIFLSIETDQSDILTGEMRREEGVVGCRGGAWILRKGATADAGGKRTGSLPCHRSNRKTP